MGSQEGTAIVYNWKWYHSAPTLALWVVLVLAIVLVKDNRNPHALLILVPLLIANLLWSIFRKTLGFRSSDAEMFGMVFNSLVMGITVLWLLGHKLGNRNRFVTFLLAFALMAVIGLGGVISYCGLEFSQQTRGALILLAMLGLAMLLGFVMSGWRCRKHYSGLRFVLWLAFWTVAACPAISLVVFLTVFIIQQTPVSISAVLFMVPIVGLILGACLYVVVFPYMILALRSSFFRERFYACLRLKLMPTATGLKIDPDRLGGQSSESSGTAKQRFCLRITPS